MKEIIFTETSEQHAREKHGIELTDIATAMRSGGLLAMLESHRPDQYQGQRLAIVALRGDVYAVPCRESETHIQLITAWVSRKFRKHYLR